MHGIWWNLFNTTSQSVLQSIQFLVLAKYLLPADYGVVGLAYVIAGFLQVFQDMGFSAVIVQRPKLEPIQMSSLWWLNIASGFFILILLGAIAWPVSTFYSMPSLSPILWALGGNFLLSSAGLQYAWICEKELRFGFLSKLDTVAGILSSAFAITLATLGFGAWSIVLANTLLAVIRTSVLVIDGRRKWKPSLSFQWSSLAGLRSFGFFQMGERTINYFNSRIDQILLGRLIDATHLGYYSFGFNLSSRLSDRTNPVVTRVAFPVFSLIQNDPERRKAIYLKLVHALTLVNAIVHLGFATLAPTLVALFFDGKWLPAVAILQIVACTYLLRSIGNPMGFLVLSTGKANVTFWWNVLVLFITPLATITGAWVGHRMGHPSIGVALAGLATQIILFYPAYRILMQPVLGKCLGSYLDATLRPIGIALIAVAIMVLVGKYCSSPILGLTLSTLAGLASFLASALLLDHRRCMSLVALIRKQGSNPSKEVIHES